MGHNTWSAYDQNFMFNVMFYVRAEHRPQLLLPIGRRWGTSVAQDVSRSTKGRLPIRWRRRWRCSCLRPNSSSSIRRQLLTISRLTTTTSRGGSFWTGASKEDNSQAEKVFKRAIALDNNYALAHRAGHLLLQRVDWLIDANPRWLDEATGLLDRAATLDSTLVELYIERTTLSQLRGDYPGAVRWARRAVAMRPLDARAHYLLAMSLYYDVRWDEADREFRRTIGKVRSSYPEPYWFRAMIAGWSGKTCVAERLLTKALEYARRPLTSTGMPLDSTSPAAILLRLHHTSTKPSR